MTKALTHRWNAPDDGRSPGNGMPQRGDVVAGARNHWRVLEVLPVESRRYPNAWRARMEPLGPHGLSQSQLRMRCGTDRWWIYERKERADA